MKTSTTTTGTGQHLDSEKLTDLQLPEHVGRMLRNYRMVEDAISASTGAPGFSYHYRLDEIPENHVESSLDLSKRLRTRVRIYKLAPETCIAEAKFGKFKHNLSTDAGNAFARYAYHSLNTWYNLVRRKGTAYTADKQRYLDLARKQDTYLIEVAALRPDQFDQHDFDKKHSLGFALITLGKKGVDDLDVFPADIQSLADNKIARLKEVIVVPSILNFPAGEITDRLFKAMCTYAPSRVFLTRIVTEPVDLAYHWSIKGLDKRGFKELLKADGSPYRVEIPDVTLYAHPAIPKSERPADITGVSIKDGLFIYDPSAPSQRHVDRLVESRKVQQYVRDRFSSSANFEKGNRVVGLWSDTYSKWEDIAFAELQDGNLVFAIELEKRDKHPYRYNLNHILGSPDKMVLPEATLDAVFCSSVLRKLAVTGVSFDGLQYSDLIELTRKNVTQFLGNTIRTLKNYGEFCLRGQFIPEHWPSEVVINLSQPEAIDRFEKYADEAYESVGVPYTKLGRGKYKLPAGEAFKFSLNINPFSEGFEEEKDYAPVGSKISEVVRFLRSEGIVVDEVTRRLDTYVLETFLEGQVTFTDPETGEDLGFPENRCEIYGQKLPSHNAAVRVAKVGDLKKRRIFNFLNSRYFRHRQSGEIRQLLSRRSPKVYNLCLLKKVDGKISIPIRARFPRPIREAMLDQTDRLGRPRDVTLGQTNRSGYAREGYSVIPEPDESVVAAIERVLRDDFQIPTAVIKELGDLESCISKEPHFPSSGTLDEEWYDVFIEIPAETLPDEFEVRHPDFGTNVRNKMQYLPDLVCAGNATAPTSTAVANAAYTYLIDKKLPIPGSGTSIVSKDQSSIDVEVTPIDELHYGRCKDNPQWQEISEDDLPENFNPFFETPEANFAEFDRNGAILRDLEGWQRQVALQFATVSEESEYTNNTVVYVPFCRQKDRILVALEMKEDLPLIQERLQLTKPEVVPAERIKRKFESLSEEELTQEALENLESRSGVKVFRNESNRPLMHVLSPEILVAGGALVERSNHFAVEVDARSFKDSNLRVYDLMDLLDQKGHFCEHTWSVLLRLAHATDKLTSERKVVSV